MHGGRSLLGVWGHPKFEFVRGDVRDAAKVRSVLDRIDAVVHLAAVVGDPACARDPEFAQEINLDASLALMSECKHAGVDRFIFASTCSNYGRMKDPDQLVDESSELRPISLYAETKVSVERAILDPSKTQALCATALRFATVYGVAPRMRFDLTVNEFTLEMLTTKHLVIYGEQFWRPYVHVRDLARAITLVLDAPAPTIRNRAFNIGSTSQNFQKKQLVEMIQPIAPNVTVERVQKDEDPRDYRVSFARIKDELGLTCGYTVPDGIREVAGLVQSGAISDYNATEYRN